MAKASWRILLVDDDEDDFLLTRDMLAESRQVHFDLVWAPTYQSARKYLAGEPYDAVLVDYDLGARTGIELIQEAAAQGYPSPMILLTARGSYEIDLQAMDVGAADYLNKADVNAAVLERSIRYAIDRRQSEDALRISQESPNPVLRIYREGKLLYANPASRSLLEGMGCQAGQTVPLEWQDYAAVAFASGEKQEMYIQTGERIYSCLVVPVIQAGYVNLYLTDVTDRERLIQENERQRANLEEHQAELERANIRLARMNAALQSSEEELQMSEGRFRVALAGAPVFVFTMDRDLRYTWIYNPPVFFDEQDILGRCDEELPEIEDVSEVTAVKRRVLQTGQREIAEVRLRWRGEWRYLVITVEPLLDLEGHVIGLTGASMDITSQRQLEARQMEYAAQTEVQRRLLQHREMERSQIARDLHDGPIQSLIGLMFSMQVAEQISQAEAGQGQSQAALMIAQVREQAQTLVQELRQFCNELRPPVLVKFGLEKAVRSHAEELHRKHPDIQVDLDLMDDLIHPDEASEPYEPDDLPGSPTWALEDQVMLVLFRIYQECINNVIRHSKASQVCVRLVIQPDRVWLEVEDNGTGFELTSDWVELAREGHLGMVGMRERVEAVGGTLDFASLPGVGTCVRAVIPRSAR